MRVENFCFNWNFGNALFMLKTKLSQKRYNILRGQFSSCLNYYQMFVSRSAHLQVFTKGHVQYAPKKKHRCEKKIRLLRALQQLLGMSHAHEIWPVHT
jgi:hypothetical protein